MELKFITPAVGLIANDVNNLGAIIGETINQTIGFGIPTGAALYWDEKNGLTGLENLIGDEVNEWFITQASDINDDGWILGAAYNRIDQRTYAVLLRPAPEAGASVLVLLSGCLLLLSRRKRKAS